MKCELCDFEGAYSLDVGTTIFTLCPNHLQKLINHNLEPKEAKKLIDKHGQKTFYLHVDFYDDEGRTMQ